MSILITILIALLIFGVVVWVIDKLPVSNSPFPFKTVLYVGVGLVFIVWLLGLLGYM